jgi:hypothetical protein
LVESNQLPLRWENFDVFDVNKNIKTVEACRQNPKFGRGWEFEKLNGITRMDSLGTVDSAMVSFDSGVLVDTAAVDDYSSESQYTEDDWTKTRYRNQTQYGVGVTYMQLFKSESALNSTINKTLNSYGVNSITQLSGVGFEAWLTPDNTMAGFSYHVNNGLVSGLSEELKSPAEYTSSYIGFSSGGIYKRRFYEIGTGGTYGHFVQRIVMPGTANGQYVFNSKRTEVIENKSHVYGLYVESKLKLKYVYVKIHVYVA